MTNIHKIILLKLDISSSYYENVIRYKKYTKQKSLQKFSKDNNSDEKIKKM